MKSTKLDRRTFLALTSTLAANAVSRISASVASQAPAGLSSVPESTRSSLVFPRGFHWGAATSAYQIEGGWKADGKGKSIWDTFSHSVGRVKNGDTGDVACDHFRRYRDDVALMRSLHFNSYRFSVSWARIQPTGSGVPNQKGLDFYRRLVDQLRDRSIRPLLTLYHWDLPDTLESAGGWPNRDTASRFADFAEIVVQALGDRVSDWILLNESRIFTTFGYLTGQHAPGRRDEVAFLRATHTGNLAQGLGFRAIKALRPSARVGTTVVVSPCHPKSSSEADQEAAARVHAVRNRWFLDPVLKGAYPAGFDHVLSPSRADVRAGDLEATRAPLDFVGVNVYNHTVVSARDDAPADPFGLKVEAIRGGMDGPQTDNGFEIRPETMYEALMLTMQEYERPVIEVTESGCAFNDQLDGNRRVRDQSRIRYLSAYLEAVLKAVADGCDVRGFHVWSLMDNFEWSDGFSQRFGLVHVDFGKLRRTVKDSGRWYASVAESNKLNAV